MRLDDGLRRKIGRLADRGIPIPYIAQAMGKSEERIVAYLKKREEMKAEKARKSMRSLVRVKDPEAYMRRKGVRYEDVMSMVRSA